MLLARASLSRLVPRFVYAQRRSNSSVRTPSFGIAFDIDGVLIRGGKQLPRARRVLQSLRANNVPHMFLTNGGGCMEDKKAANLSTILDLPIEPQHMVLSHTPMRALAAAFSDKRVLIMGSHDVYTVAKHYGFNKVTTVQDFLHQYPTQYPFHHYEHRRAPFQDEPVAAVIVMHDPVDWAPELQVAVDVLIGGDPPGSGHAHGNQTPLFVSNDDFVFAGDYPSPRFAQGAFTKCLALLFEERTGRPLDVTRYGKPHTVTYAYAEQLLHAIASDGVKNSDATRVQPQLDRIYGIGDNPHADIQGANNAGANWSSILVRTGIYDSTSGPPAHAPDVLVDDVWDAVAHIYDREGLDASLLL